MDTLVGLDEALKDDNEENVNNSGDKINLDNNAKIENNMEDNKEAIGKNAIKEEIKENWKLNRVFDPNMDDEVRKKKIFGWKKAVNRSLSWDKE